MFLLTTFKWINHVQLRPTISLVTFLWPTSYLDNQCLLLLHIVYACKLGRVYNLHTKTVLLHYVAIVAAELNLITIGKNKRNLSKIFGGTVLWDIHVQRPAILYKNKTIFHNPNKICGLCCAINSYRKFTENSGYLSGIWCGDILRGDSWDGNLIYILCMVTPKLFHISY